MMDDNFETMIDGILERIAQGYNQARIDWLADRKSPFKDGKFLAYYEAKEAFLKYADELDDALEAVAELYRRARADWMRDRKNAFKDGKFLACFEILNMIPAAG